MPKGIGYGKKAKSKIAMRQLRGKAPTTDGSHKRATGVDLDGLNRAFDQAKRRRRA